MIPFARMGGMQQFLIVKTSAIGDVIQSFHIVDYLKNRFPNSSIDWVVEKGIAPLLKAHPHLDRVLEVDTKLWRRAPLKHFGAITSFKRELRKKNYDALFDLQGNTKSGLVCCLAKARKKVGYSWGCVAEKPNYFSTNVHLAVPQEGSIRNRYLGLVENFLGKEEDYCDEGILLNLTPSEESGLQRLAHLGFQRPRLMICFGSNWENKMLSQNTLKAFLHLINEQLAPCFFFIYGNDREKKIAEGLEKEFAGSSHAVGELTLPLWQRFMSLVEGVITMDSASLHLCGTTSTPSFSLFGPSSAAVYKPLGEIHCSFQGTCPYGIQFDKRCPNLRTCETGACLKEVSADLLFHHFQEFWDKAAVKVCN